MIKNIETYFKNLVVKVCLAVCHHYAYERIHFSFKLFITAKKDLRNSVGKT